MVATTVEESNFTLFRDCLASPIIEISTYEPSRKPKKIRGDGKGKSVSASLPPSEPDAAEELAEFIDYIASEWFGSLPTNLRTLTYTAWLTDSSMQAQYTTPLNPRAASSLLNSLPPTVGDSLLSYNLLPVHTSLEEFLTPVMQSYMTAATAPAPPSISRSLATECEICTRSWIPLTYHHLIPKEVHAKVVKRGWHREEQLQNVAWLCRACHSFVHRVASNEELARDWFTVEKLLEREDVRDFAAWVGRVRWKAS